MVAILTIESVSKRFGQYVALDSIQLSVEQGEFIALLGPSGCGKTSLLRSIAGFLQPDEGRIFIDGQDVSRLPPHRRPLNTVFQNYALFPHLSVLENVEYGPRRQGVSRGEASERAAEALKLVGLAEFDTRYPSELSGGQQQRVALARAVVNRPKLLLLDEPLSALDMKLRKRMQLELKHLQSKLGIAFLFVTHDQEEAMTMADRIVVMNAGRIEQIGVGTEIYREPASHFVAEFIGDANFIDFVASERGCIRLATQQLEVAQLRAHASKGVAVLRPEHLLVLEDPLLDKHQVNTQRLQHCILKGKVTEVVSVGSHTFIHVDVDGNILVARATGLPGDSMRAGRLVQLGFLAANLHQIGEQT